MARIRSIKPEFWDSASTAYASLRARLLYISMWNWADDYGIGDATPIRLIGFAFPNDDIAVAEYPQLLAEMSNCYGVVFYNFEGRPYYFIPEWEKHQRTEKRAKQRVPFPDMTPKPLDHAEVLSSVGSSDAFLGHPGAGTGEQGNRGTGVNTSSPAAPSMASVDQFDEFYAAYPKKVGKDLARKAFVKAAKTAGAEAVIDGARRIAADPNLPEKQFIPHPATWLNRGGWSDEPYSPRTNGRPTTDTRFSNVQQLKVGNQMGVHRGA